MSVALRNVLPIVACCWGVEPSRPNVVPPLAVHFARSFEGSAALLVPRFGDEPTSCWSRYFVLVRRGKPTGSSGAGHGRSAPPAHIHAFDTHSGAELWQKPAPVRVNAELLIATSRVAVFATSYEVFALDVMTGTRRWSHGQYPQRLDVAWDDWEDGESFRAHALKDDRLVSIRDNGQMSCIAIDTGKLIWSKTHRRGPPAGGLRLADRWVVYHIVDDGRPRICLIDARTGEWYGSILTGKKRAVEDIFITLDGQIVLVTSRSFLSYDPGTGKRLWQVSPGGRIRRASLLLGVEGIYFSDNGRRAKKISLEDGHLLWESEPLGGTDDGLTIERLGESLIVSSASSVSAINAVMGLTLWRGVIPERARFAARLVTQSYVIAVDIPYEPSRRTSGSGSGQPPLHPPHSIAYFCDHRPAPPPRDSEAGESMSPIRSRERHGLPSRLGRLVDVRAIMAADSVLLIQTGSTVHGWTHK